MTGLAASTALPYLGIRVEELNLDEKAEILFVGQGYSHMNLPTPLVIMAKGNK